MTELHHMHARPKIIPSILVHSEREFCERLRLVARMTSRAHLDVADGIFVPNRTWANPRTIARVRTPVRMTVHLMVQSPTRAIAQWGRNAHVERIVVHAESTENFSAWFARIRRAGKQVGLAVNPTTPLVRIVTVLPHIDFLLIMANAPGFSGRPFRRATLRRIIAIRRRHPQLAIGVDIGVNIATVPELVAAGANELIAGSAIFDAPDPIAAYRTLVRAARAPPHP